MTFSFEFETTSYYPDSPLFRCAGIVYFHQEYRHDQMV